MLQFIEIIHGYPGSAPQMTIFVEKRNSFIISFLLIPSYGNNTRTADPILTLKDLVDIFILWEKKIMYLE